MKKLPNIKSKKKRKVTTVLIKQENAKRKRKGTLERLAVDGSKKVQTKLMTVKLSDCGESKHNKVVKNNHQKKEYVTVESNQILTYLRTYETVPSAMLSTIEKNVLNDFYTSYTIKAKSVKRTSPRQV